MNERALRPLRDALVGQVLVGSAGVRYFLRECIGEGGQGWVFRAHWGEPDGVVVVAKVLRPDAVGKDALGRFEREAMVLRTLCETPPLNPHIVRFFDHGNSAVPGSGASQMMLPFTVLEYVQGISLDHALAAGEPLLLARTRRIVRHLVRALEHVHAQGIVHRDLKPSNILLTSDASGETAKITDFGLVKRMGTAAYQTFSLGGASLGYAAPEQYNEGGSGVSARTDVFALAAVFYELLTGEAAFPEARSESPFVFIGRLLTGAPPKLEAAKNLAVERGSAWAFALEKAIAKALSADPKERHASATEFWEAVGPPLDACLSASSDHTTAMVGSASMRAMAKAETAPAFPQVVHTAKLPAVEPKARGSTVVMPERMSVDLTRKSQLPEEMKRPRMRWALVSPPVAGATLRAGVLSETGQRAFATSGRELLLFQEGRWTTVVDGSFSAARKEARGIAMLGDDALVLGTRAMVEVYSTRGSRRVWEIPDVAISFLGACADGWGGLTVVGERPVRTGEVASGASSCGVVARLGPHSLLGLAEVALAPSLRGAALLSNGNVLVCGDQGTLVEVGPSDVRTVPRPCEAHLYGVAASRDGGAFVVGAGGYAFHMNYAREMTLERVETTQNLFALAVDRDGVAWAGGGAGRLLRRTEEVWTRMNHALPTQATLLALSAHGACVRALLSDASVLEGIPQ